MFKLLQYQYNYHLYFFSQERQKTAQNIDDLKQKSQAKTLNALILHYPDYFQTALLFFISVYYCLGRFLYFNILILPFQDPIPISYTNW